jgi:thiamine biosynthesis lipoprotein
MSWRGGAGGALLLLAILGPAAPPLAAEPIRIASQAFGLNVEIEARGLPTAEAEAATQKAMEEILAIERLTAVHGKEPGGLGAVNDTGSGVVVDRRLLRLLARARDFCRWSRGAHGPLGGRLYDLWGLRSLPVGLPTSQALAAAVPPANCGGLLLDADQALVRRPPTAVVDLWGFAQGFAVDRAIEVLKELGATSAWVEIGGICRGAGGGLDGRGWPLDLPSLEGFEEPLETLWLKDQSLTLLRATDQPFIIGGDSYPPYLDQRTGRPPTGVEAVIVATELAVDSEALAVALFAVGNREGLLRLGSLRPRPAVLWLLGNGEGTPLMETFHWSQLTLR